MLGRYPEMVEQVNEEPAEHDLQWIAAAKPARRGHERRVVNAQRRAHPFETTYEIVVFYVRDGVNPAQRPVDGAPHEDPRIAVVQSMSPDPGVEAAYSVTMRSRPAGEKARIGVQE